MTKFGSEDDPGFIAVAGELRRWMKELGRSSMVDRIMKQEQRVRSPATTSTVGEDVENCLIQIRELEDSIRTTLGLTQRDIRTDSTTRVFQGELPYCRATSGNGQEVDPAACESE